MGREAGEEEGGEEKVGHGKANQTQSEQEKHNQKHKTQSGGASRHNQEGQPNTIRRTETQSKTQSDIKRNQDTVMTQSGSGLIASIWKMFQNQWFFKVLGRGAGQRPIPGSEVGCTGERFIER